MELSEDEIIQKNGKNVDIVIEIISYHIHMNGHVFHVDST